MLQRLLLCFVVCLCGSTIAQNVPQPCANVDAGKITPAPPLPSLPMTAFKSVVRAVIINKNYTTEAIEYVDEKSNAAALVFMNAGQQQTIIMHYSTGESFYVATNPSTPGATPLCDVKNLTNDDNTQLFGMKGDSSSGGLHLFSTSKILNFINGSVTYKGQKVLDGIQVTQWSSCLYWPQLKSNFSLDYYFSAPKWGTPSGGDQIPVQAEIQGVTTYPNGTSSSFHHIYQYVNFENYVDDPEGIFQTPPGVYCMMRQPTYKPPQLPNHFFYREEVTNPAPAESEGISTISEADIWYDYDLKLVRFDTRNTPQGTSVDFTNSNGPFTTIHDYGTGVQYTIDQYSGRCSMDPIPATARGFDAVQNITVQTLGMRGPMSFFNLDDSSYLYAGRRQARGVTCDVFQAVLTNIPDRGLVVYEVYFTANTQEITDTGSVDGSRIGSVPIRIMEWEDGSLVTEYNIHDFDPETATFNKYDVTPCFYGNNAKDFELFMSISKTGSNNNDLMATMTPYLDALMHMDLALTMGTTPIRIQNTRINWDANNVYYWATLLGAPPSFAKYQFNPGKAMAVNAGKVIPNVADKFVCAQNCDNNQGWVCREFDYCQSTQTCTIANDEPAISNPSTWANNTQCDHYTRVLGGGFDTQVQLSDGWTKIKNQVYQNHLAFTLPLPDGSGNVDLTVDTTTLSDSQKVTFSAYMITDQVVSCNQVYRNPNAAVPLPNLPMTSFKSVVRAVIMNKKYTTEAIEYVDEKYNAAALVFMNAGQQQTIIMHYSTGESFYVATNPSTTAATFPSGSCDVKNLTNDDNTQLFGMRGDTSVGGFHLFSTTKILNFINGSEVYKGQTVIDGIQVNQWSSYLYWPQLNSNFTLDYYFSAPGWGTPSGIDQIPVQAEIQGVTTLPNGTITNFHHIYQYVNFENYVDDPEGIFETPPGVYCSLRQPTMKLPQLPNQFYYREEITNPGTDTGGYPSMMETDIWYDYNLQLVRFDTRGAPDGTSVDFTNSNGPFTTIHDYGTGVQYTIDQYSKRCSMDPIPSTARGFDALQNFTVQTLGMRGPMSFFNLDASTYLYAGQRQARGVTCNVFQTVLTNLPNRGLVVYEVYFTAGVQDITDTGANGGSSGISVPIRIMEWEDGSLVTEYNIHNFDPETATFNKYDVTPCFFGNNVKDFELFMRISKSGSSNNDLMVTMTPYLDGLMHMNLALTMGTTPIRIQNTRMHWDANNVYYQATLLGAPPSFAKYQFNPGKTMAANAGTVIPNVANKFLCAQDCDNKQEWNCREFDYCQSTHVCTLAKDEPAVSDPSTWANSTQCDHYSRVLGGGFDTQVQLGDGWMKIKNQVYQNQLAFVLPLPDDSGNIDMTADASKIDDSQKVTFTAYMVTDQVVASNQVNRNPVTAIAIGQFSRIPRHMGKGYDDTIRGISVDDCASDCVAEQTYTCQSFHYCWEAGTCFLSRRHPDEQPDSLRFNSNCDLYYRNYTSDFQVFPGATVLSASNTIYQNVIGPNQCAKLCTYYSSFHCESFDFCSDVNTCYLGQTHYYDAPRANIQQRPSCSHYSRNYLADFLAKKSMMVAMRDNRVVQNVSPQECAKLCSQEQTFTCQSFDYCGNLTECRLSDASIGSTGQVTLQASAICDVYQRQFSSGATAASQSSSNSNSGYSGGAMGGLAFSMVIVGLVLGAAAIFLCMKYRGGAGGGDGMTIAFSKQELEER